jgi:hypothetical protein
MAFKAPSRETGLNESLDDTRRAGAAIRAQLPLGSDMPDRADAKVPCEDTEMRKTRFFALALAGLGLAQSPNAVADVAPNPPPVSKLSGARPTIFATVRMSNVAQSLKTLSGYVPFPLPLADTMQQTMGDFAKVIQLSAPVDLVFALESDTARRGTPPWAVSFQVSSAEETRRIAKAQGVLGENRGNQTVIGLPLGKSASLPCLLSGNTGPGRMVCADNERDRDLLQSSLQSLNVPAAQGKDLYAELSVAGVLSVYSTQWQQVLDAGTMMLPQRLSIGNPQFDRAATDAIKGLVGEVSLLSKDLSLLALDLAIRPDQVQFSVGYKMTGTQSAWAKTDAESAARKPSGPPPVFFTLPKDVVSASYHTTDPKLGFQVLAALLPLVDAFLQHDGLPEPDRVAVRDLFQKVPKWDGLMTTVLGEGSVDKPQPGADPLTAVLGSHYYLSTSERSDGKPDESAAFVRGLTQVWNRPGIAAYLRKKWKTAGIKTPMPVLRAENVTKQLGPQATGMFLSLDLSGLSSQFDKSGKGPKHGPFSLYIVSAAIGGRTWNAVGGDKNLLIQKLQKQATLPAAETLAQRSGIAQLQEPSQGGGFTTLAGWVGTIDSVLRAADKRGVAAKTAEPERSGASLLSVIPHHGEVPLTYTSRAGQIGPQGLTRVITLTVPQLVIEDLIALTMNLAQKGK